MYGVPPRITLNSRHADIFRTAHAANRCAWDSAASDLQQVLLEQGITQRLDDIAEVARSHLQRNGYCLFYVESASDIDPDWAAIAATALVSLVAEPISIFHTDRALWRELPVDLARPPDRSRGAGSQPLHHDFVNAQRPPDVVCIYCRRSDPLGGGQSLVAVLDDIRDQLTPSAISILSEPIFSDGAVVDLENVGEDINPFSVLDDPRGALPVRFTGRLLKGSSGTTRSALSELLSAVAERTVTLPLKARELLLIDQRRAIHGRAAMGAGQAALSPAQRRLLMLSFGRCPMPQ